MIRWNPWNKESLHFNKFLSWIKRAKNFMKSVVPLRIACKEQVTCRTLLLSVFWIFRWYSFSSLQKQELCARFWLNINQCKTAIKSKLDKIWLEREEKFYENNSSVDPFQLVSRLPCKAIMPPRSIMLSAKLSLHERSLLDWTNLP